MNNNQINSCLFFIILFISCSVRTYNYNFSGCENDYINKKMISGL